MRMRATRVMTLAVVTVTGLGLSTSTHQARQPEGERAPITGIHEVADNLYMLANSDPSNQATWTGGNTAVWVTETGVLLVDTKLSGYGQDILDLVATVTDKPVVTIVNTHTHYDHSGSNTEFPDPVEFVAHENTAANMALPTCEPVTNCDAFKGENARYLPDRTYRTRMSLFSGDDRVDLYYFGRGHTDGDSFVVFPAARTMHTGDIFAWKALPFVDVENSGGSATEYGDTLSRAVAGIPDVDTVIAGHIEEPVAWSDFVEFTGFYNDLVQVAREGMAAGRDVDAAAGGYVVPDRYADFEAAPDTVLSIMQHVYAGR